MRSHKTQIDIEFCVNALSVLKQVFLTMNICGRIIGKPRRNCSKDTLHVQLNDEM